MATSHQIYESYQSQYRALGKRLEALRREMEELGKQLVEALDKNDKYEQADIETRLKELAEEKDQLESQRREAARSMVKWSPIKLI